jgi:hypothetical protein
VANVGDAAVKPRADRRKVSGLRGTYTFEGERFELTGKAALVLARLAACSDWLNETEYGRVVLNFGHAEVKPELTQCLPAIRLED